MNDRDFRKAADAITREVEGLLSETLEYIDFIQSHELRRKKTRERARSNLADLTIAASALDKARRSYRRVLVRMVPK